MSFINLQGLEKNFSTIVIAYFFTGLIFAVSYALFYHWEAFSFFSPGFYVVVLTWPLQVPGFINDFRLFGFAGKVLF